MRPAGPRSAVKALVVRDGQVLMNHYRDGDDGHDVFSPPGGGQEHGETCEQALQRECREEIGVDVTVHTVACVYEILDVPPESWRSATSPFHQVNVAYWCGLPPGAEPGLGPEPDPRQIGVRWLPIVSLADYDVRPLELGRWLRSDPGSRPVGIGVTRL